MLGIYGEGEFRSIGGMRRVVGGYVVQVQRIGVDGRRRLVIEDSMSTGGYRRRVFLLGQVRVLLPVLPGVLRQLI